MDGPKYSGAGAMLTGVITPPPPPPHVVSWYDFLFTFPWLSGFVGVLVALTGALIVTFAMKTWEERRSSGNERREPPWLAETLLGVFARTKDIEALLGDFEEDFKRHCACMSERRAVRRYWARVLRSVGPQMWQAIRRIGLLGLIAAALRR